MPLALKAPISNQLLDSLPVKMRIEIYKMCESVELIFGSILCEPEQPIKYAYFPITGFISLVAIVENHQPLEVGLIGNEGMLGVTLALGMPQAPMRALVQGSGTALRISAGHLRQALQSSPLLTKKFNMYVYLLLVQMANMTACIHFHGIESRLARWLLMTQDRTYANRLHLTQSFLADMLGVRRSGVTVAAGALQNRNLIHYSRGEITILDRKGLEVVACRCYQIMQVEYQQLFNTK